MTRARPRCSSTELRHQWADVRARRPAVRLPERQEADRGLRFGRQGHADCRGRQSNDLVVLRNGAIYFTDPENQQIWYVSPKGEKRVVDRGLGYANGIVTPDQGTLVVADMKKLNLWAYRVEPDGGLKFKQPYYTLRTASGKIDSGADGMTIDSPGRLYVSTHLGLQMFDHSGRLCGVIDKPQNAWLANVVFAGPKLDTLYVTCTNKVFKRKVNAKGMRYFDPARPRNGRPRSSHPSPLAGEGGEAQRAG